MENKKLMREAEATIQIAAAKTCKVDEMDESNKPSPHNLISEYKTIPAWMMRDINDRDQRIVDMIRAKRANA